jgi:hypothetical protein
VPAGKAVKKERAVGVVVVGEREAVTSANRGPKTSLLESWIVR